MNKLVNDIYDEYVKILKNFIGNDTTYADDLRKNGKILFGRRFIGVFPSDQLPNIKNNEMYIANLDKSNF